MLAPSDALTGPSYLALPSPPESWLVENFLPPGGSALLYGVAKTGKSFAALQLAEAVASGRPVWLGQLVLAHGPALYLQLDTPRWIWAKRLRDLTSLEGLCFDNVYLADRQIAPYPFDLLAPEARGWLADQVAKIRPLLVVIDTLAESHNADERDAREMKGILQAIRECVGERCAIVLVTHAKKEQPLVPGDLMGDIRGSSYIPGAMDGIMKFLKKPSMCCWQSRTAPESEFAVRQDAHSGMVKCSESAESLAVRVVLADPDLPESELVRRISQLAPGVGLEERSFEAWRSLLRRVRKKTVSAG